MTHKLENATYKMRKLLISNVYCYKLIYEAIALKYKSFNTLICIYCINLYLKLVYDIFVIYLFAFNYTYLLNS